MTGNTFAETGTRLQVWHQMIYSHREVLAEVLREFEKRNPGVTVQSTYRETEELRSAYQASAIGGTGPELIYGPSDQIGPYATMGIVRPLEQELGDAFFKSFDPLAAPVYMNHHFMIGDNVGNNLMLLYNKKLIQVPPQNTQELIEMGQKLTLRKDNKVQQYGLVFNYTEPFFFVPWLAGFGEHFIDENAQPHLDTVAARKAFQFILDLRDKYKIIPRECDYEMANALFKDNKAAMIINGDWSWGDYRKANIDFGVARIPMVSETGLWPAPLVGTTGYSMNVHMKSPAHHEATLKLLKYLTSPEVQLIFSQKVGSLPSNLETRKLDGVKNNALLKAAADVMSVGKPMPVVPEVRAIWDSLRAQYQGLLGGNVSPDEAARNSQVLSQEQIKAMNEVIEPGLQATVLKALIAGLLLLVIWGSRQSLLHFIAGFKGPQKFAYYMMLPAFIAIFAVIIYPFFYNIAISFSNFSLKTFQTWSLIGLQHYTSVLVDPRFYSLLWKTVLWTVINVFFHVSIGVFLAVIINQIMPAKAFWRTLLIVPWAVPQYITALTWRGLFNQEYGPINIFLQNYLHLPPVQWLTQPWTTFAACVITNVWLGFPFMMVIALGGLQSIPASLYEAAKMDGAHSWQRFRHITWPLLQPVMKPAALLGSIWTFNNLNVIWLVSNAGEPGDQTHILVSYVYKAAFNLYRYGYAAALSVLIFIILIIWGLSSLRAQYQKESES